MDCGPTCLRMISRFYGKHYNIEGIRKTAGFSKRGVSLLGISEAAEKMGFKTRGVKITCDKLIDEVDVPCILHWDQSHYVVLLPRRRWIRRRRLRVADPAEGIISHREDEFRKHWLSSTNERGEQVGTVLLLEPTPIFYRQPGEKEGKLNWAFILRYVRNSGWQISQVFMALIITSLLQTAFPYMTQSIVDTGIGGQNLPYITVVLCAQFMLIFSRTMVDFIRSRILLNISIGINLGIVSDFLIKLTRLPLAYFDSRQTGDTLQRLGDNRQIQSFLTDSVLSTLFSVFNFGVFVIILASYSVRLFFIFFAGSVLYYLWIRIFLHIRRKINYETFHLSAAENNATLQLIQGMQDIRLNNAQRLKRWEWENIQAGIARLNFKSLTYNQYQQAGALFINQGKDLMMTYIVSQLVIQGELTFGTMLAVQYIIGQLSSPIQQFITFIQHQQDARISMERLNEVHEMEDEEDLSADWFAYLPSNQSIEVNNLSFSYPGTDDDPVLRNISLAIPEGKVTAIVGVSGSGKTTLLKLLLKVYHTYKGDIRVGGSNFQHIRPSFWRQQCGAVLQDGYIFNDTIAGNIAVGEETVDYERLINACRIANILSFIESLPNGFYTKFGSDGVGVSQGQKQRLLIARAVYKDPVYLLFDEATNALDANNERDIVENLQQFFKGRTVIIVAHRLSTVKNADKIIVLDQGMIVEEGTHQQLSGAKGKYYELVRNQLELGN